MVESANETATQLLAWTNAVDELLRRTESTRDRAGSIAQLLHDRSPATGMIVCRLDNADGVAVGVSPADAGDSASWIAHFSRPYAQWSGEKKGTVSLDLGEEDGALVGVIAPISFRDRSWGLLLSTLPADASAEDKETSRRQLTALARGLALCLVVDEAERRLNVLREERRALTDMVTIGEAMVSLLHGLNNSLNTMMLQAAVVQLKVDEPVRQEIGLIRKEGAAAAGRMRPLMQFRELRRQSRGLVDLHPVVRSFLAEPREATAGSEAHLEATRSKVTAHVSDLKRLMHYLVHVAVPRVSGVAMPCRFRTANQDGELLLIVEPIDGWQPPSPEPGRPFDPYNDTSNTDDLLERLALDSLLRLVGAAMRTYPSPHGRTTTVIAWSNAR